TTTVPNGSVPDGTYDVADTFALARFAAGSRLTVSTGLRAETAKLHSDPKAENALTPFTVDDLRLDKRWNSLTWSAGAVLDVGAGWSLAGNVARGFRAPTFSDTLSTGVPVFASGVASVPSPNVKPERSVTYEAGPRYVSTRLNLSVTAYTNHLTDQLSSEAAGTINIPGVGVVNALRNANIATAYIRGVEVAVAFRPVPSLTIFGNMAVTRGQDTTKDVPLRFIPPANGTIGARWQNPSSRWWLEGTAMIADKLRRHAPNDEIDAGFSTDPGFGSPSATNPALPGFQINGFTVATARLGANVWTGGSQRRQRLDLTMDVNNIFNAKYREAYSQQQLYAPGFGVVIAARVGF
ncbi:MAG: TonB-dependent receptor, partial [Acidobacteriota bacterium]